MEKSPLYQQVGGKILAYKTPDGDFVEIKDRSNLDDFVDLRLPVQQLPAHGLRSNKNNLAIPGFGQSQKTDTSYTSKNGTLQEGKIYVSSMDRGNTINSIPMVYTNGKLRPVLGFTRDEANTVGHKNNTIDNRVRDFANNNQVEYVHPDLFGDLATHTSMSEGTKTSAFLWDDPVSVDEINSGNITPKTTPETYEPNITGEQFLDKLKSENNNLYTQFEEPKNNQLSQQGDLNNLGGYTPGYKGIYKDTADKNLNKEAVNNLFTQYHNRDANQQEIDYWTSKRVGDLEDTLAKTTIFSAEDADKIRQEMMNQGKTYISNQAELENLSRAGGLDPATITTQGSMLFQPTLRMTSQQADTKAVSTPTENIPTPLTEDTTTPEPTNSNDDALAMIDSAVEAGTIPADIGQLFKQTIEMYPEGLEFNTDEILNTFNKIKDETLDPHFRELADIAMDDFSSAYQQLQEERGRGLQAERYNAGERIRQARSGLEKAGMTFSGKAIEQLGKNSVFPQTVDETKFEQGQVPQQQPFGGLNFEGIAPMKSRLIAESSASQYQKQLRNIGRGIEKMFGTDNMNPVPGYTPLGGITGSLDTQKQQQYGTTLNQIINNYIGKQNLLRNIQP